MRSVTDALQPAWTTMVRTLFAPFDLGHWFSLAFSAFLAGLGEGGGGGSWGSRMGPGDGAGEVLGEAGRWISAHLSLVIALGVLALLLAGGVMALLLWLGSRGTFMFLDNLATGRAEVVEPWRRFRRLGNSLFLLRFALGWALLGAILLLAGLAWLIARPDIHAARFGTAALGGLVTGGCLLALLLLGMALVHRMLVDFVVPVMYRRDLGALAAIRVFQAEILPGHGGTLALFYLLRLALSLGAGVATLAAGCATCCLGFLPYLSSVLALPVLVFFRAWSLHFLGQWGPEFQVLREVEPPPMAP